eukprot:TRINITY_DN1297_c0_g1_i1.p1 TRINITY_DN1297_c0_g1~~TRINITY_DN1297_c0_g1_i1.p1  ORF type:complete len:306 (-),score=78.52 TRINITY_DN1297_c0_g1_i1:71-934(-)
MRPPLIVVFLLLFFSSLSFSKIALNPHHDGGAKNIKAHASQGIDPTAAVLAYFQAVTAHDVVSLMSTFASDAVVITSEGVYKGIAQIRSFYENGVLSPQYNETFFPDPGPFYINNNVVAVEIALHLTPSRVRRVGDWFTVNPQGRISSLVVYENTNPNFIPDEDSFLEGVDPTAAVKAYFSAVTAYDLGRLVSVFADDAVILSNNGIFKGKDQIREFYRTGVLSNPGFYPHPGTLYYFQNVIAVEIALHLSPKKVRHVGDWFFVNQKGLLSRLVVYENSNPILPDPQ